MTRRFTRREIATALAATGALAAQSSNPPLPQSPDEELKAARDLLRQNLDQIARFPLLMTTEPAVHFKA